MKSIEMFESYNSFTVLMDVTTRWVYGNRNRLDFGTNMKLRLELVANLRSV